MYTKITSFIILLHHILGKGVLSSVWQIILPNWSFSDNAKLSTNGDLWRLRWNCLFHGEYILSQIANNFINVYMHSEEKLC